ncbi:hypothetical protein [Pseudoxanthomonas wuyuanensis]|uniref:hypothetical protein n=1 Tax=Pseudoxanthomonas wuyuanensis TaxID=1073196 RepID=UPI0011440845|nr:hypothetical protein [Pseudoxanthomonas wuyuanensis]
MNGLADKYGVKNISFLDSIPDDEERALLYKMLDEAREYLSGFDWCSYIKSVYFGCGIGGIFSVFMFDIANKASNSDNLLWVVVGDIPPAYLVVADGPSCADEALKAYVDIMQEWVNSVNMNLSVDDKFPVDAPATVEYAGMLGSRLDYIRENFI